MAVVLVLQYTNYRSNKRMTRERHIKIVTASTEWPEHQKNERSIKRMTGVSKEWMEHKRMSGVSKEWTEYQKNERSIKRMNGVSKEWPENQQNDRNGVSKEWPEHQKNDRKINKTTEALTEDRSKIIRGRTMAGVPVHWKCVRRTKTIYEESTDTNITIYTEQVRI